MRWRVAMGAALAATVLAAVWYAVVRPGSDQPYRLAGFSPGAAFLWGDAHDVERDLDGMRDAGSAWVRIDIDWSLIESTKGDPDWARTDRAVHGARERGLDVLGLIAYTPSWARPEGTSDKHPPSRSTDFAAFAARAVARYRDVGVRHWEMWNEPNLTRFWEPRPDPGAYAQLLRAAAGAIRDVDPDAVIVSGGLSPASDDGEEVAPARFLEAVYASGGGGSFDAVGHHPYHFPCPLDTDGSWNAWRAVLPELRELMVRHGDADKRIWLTEYGAPTGTSPRAVSDEGQARFVEDAFATARETAWIGPLFWYSYRDAGRDLEQPEHNFGLVRHDFEPKPALRVFEDVMARMDGPRPDQPAEEPDPRADRDGC